MPQRQIPQVPDLRESEGKGLNMGSREQGSLPEELEASVAACSTRRESSLTRKEIAAVFGVSPRTIARWELARALPTVRENARVLRYPIEAVVVLCASGVAIDRKAASQVGLLPEALFAIAGRLRTGSAPKDLLSLTERGCVPPTPDDDRRLAALWGHPEVGPVLRILVRMLSASLRPSAP